MTTKIKTTLLTAFFLFGLLTGLQAQDKYDKSIVVYYPALHLITVSINGDGYEEIKVTNKDLKAVWDLNPLIRKVNELEEKGWEIFNTSNGDSNVMYYLRKKKN